MLNIVNMRKLIISLAVILLSSFVVLAQRSDGKPSVSVSGRNTVGNLPHPVYNSQESGVVVVDIWVDNYGNVVKAVPGGDGTTVDDKTLFTAARKAAMETHFNMSADAPATQEGTIVYNFVPSKQSETNDGALKFLGIPIDGTKAQFVAQLKNKGFIYNSRTEGYKGQFNGRDVDVFVHTNHNLVDRVYVAFPYTNEESIRVEFNRLLSQFRNNDKYMDLSMNEDIPNDEDISYEIAVNNKRYQASFCYFDPNMDADTRGYALIDKLEGILPDSTIAELKSYAAESIGKSEGEKQLLSDRVALKVQEALGNDEEKAVLLLAAFMDGLRSLADGDVWFMIHENYGRYQIGLYYDNRHNQAHGEDL